jgi:hypothetical protein
MDRSRRCGALVVLIACLVALGGLLPTTARAAERFGFGVLVSPTGDDPQVAMRTRERVVVVWGDKTGVMARYFRVDKTDVEPLGRAFRVDEGAVPNRPKPRVSMDRDGNFVVVWDAGDELRAQLFGADGARRGGILSLSNAGDGGQPNQPRVSMAPDGRFVVAWEDLATHRLRYALFGADGNRLGEVRALPARSTGGAASVLVDVGAGTESFAAAWNEAVPHSGGGTQAIATVAFYDWNGRLLRRLDRFGGTPLVALSWSNAGPVALVVENTDSRVKPILMQRFSPVTGNRVGPLRRLPDAYLASLIAVDSDPRGRLVGLFEEAFPVGPGFRSEYEPGVQLYGPEGKSASPRLFASGLSSMEPLSASSVALTRDGMVAAVWKYVYEHQAFGATGIRLDALRLP